MKKKEKEKTLGLRNIHLYNVLNTLANFKTWWIQGGSMWSKAQG
jgi:hypothetical protein